MWTDLSIEQRRTKTANLSEGLSGGRIRTHESSHKLWNATLRGPDSTVEDSTAELYLPKTLWPLRFN